MTVEIEIWLAVLDAVPSEGQRPGVLERKGERGSRWGE
jgi:hypothetical protein